ncbi:MAG: RNA polymerase sigma factor [Cyclobacteriaceae bacterium]
MINSCQRQHRPAQEQFYKHFYRYAMSICMPYSQSKFEAEEIANDGFMKVFKNIKDYSTKFPIEGWVRKIMINTAIDYFRSNKKHYHALDITEATTVHDEDVSVLDKMGAEDIMRHVQELPPAYRVAFTLYNIEGYKHQEIAKKLNISEGTSKSNLAKAKAKLKQAILSNHSLTN